MHLHLHRCRDVVHDMMSLVDSAHDIDVPHDAEGVETSEPVVRLTRVAAAKKGAEVLLWTGP